MEKDKEELKLKQEQIGALYGKFVPTDNKTMNFKEELSDGGERNEMAKEQLKRITDD